MTHDSSRFGRTPQGAVLLLLLLLLPLGCSGKRVMVRSAGILIPDAMATFYDEPDWELARAAGLSNLKLLETLHRASPEDEAVLVALAEAFGGVALAFLEEEIETHRDGDEALLEEARQRAAGFYGRGRDYAGLALELRHPGILEQLERGGEAALACFTTEDVPALFWYAFNQAGELWLERNDPTALRSAPLNRRLALRLAELERDHFFGGPLLLLAISDAYMPAMFGGSLESSERRFQEALDLSGGRFLLSRVLRAEHCIVARGDRERFDSELQAVLDAPADILPGHRLFTTMAQRRAARLARRAARLF